MTGNILFMPKNLLILIFLWITPKELIKADIYLHNPRGSNNRLDEQTRERANGNKFLRPISRDSLRYTRNLGIRNDKVKLMVAALESHGCPVDLTRHISCEPCRDRVNGGFDPKAMQVVICQNNIQSRDICCNVLAHELLHAFDFCRAKVDFENLRHLACTEIRAANMFHCSLAAAFSSGEASLFNIKERHQLCVKNKALQSVKLVRNVSELEAMVAIDEVFDKCYNDTEPFGRRCFKNLGRVKRAFNESRNYYDFEDF
ncbi:Mitochondrial inner membrane protease atp23 [Bulinus truncatus]|nr:Mitochondrial inner membrane protease atp23 [Bulinus truncatus]